MLYPVRSRKKAAMTSHYAWYCYDLYHLTFPRVSDVFPIITLRRLLINTDLLPQYGQTVVILTCSSLNHDSSMQTIRNGLSTSHLTAAGNRAYMQSLISLTLFFCRIFPIESSIGDSLLRFRWALFFSFLGMSSLTVLTSPLVASLVLFVPSFPSLYY